MILVKIVSGRTVKKGLKVNFSAAFLIKIEPQKKGPDRISARASSFK